jgi:hypothetical protein
MTDRTESELRLSPEKADELERLVHRYNSLELERYLEERQLFRAAVLEGRQRGMRVPPKPNYKTLTRLPAVEAGEPVQAAGRAAPLIVRSFQAASVAVDGRTVEVLVVPYGSATRVVDKPSNGGTGKPYVEEWCRGAFKQQLGSRAKIFVNVEHEPGIRGVVGHGVELRDTSDGLAGSFKIHATPDGDKALELVRAGVLDGVSLEAIALESVRKGGVVRRVRAKLEAIALTRRPAYPDARVLAVRDER